MIALELEPSYVVLCDVCGAAPMLNRKPPPPMLATGAVECALVLGFVTDGLPDDVGRWLCRACYQKK